MRESIVWLRRLVFEYGSSPPISLDLCADDEDPSQLIIRPGWDAPHVRCFPRTFCAWPCLLRQVGTVLGSPYDYVVARLAYANPGSRHSEKLRRNFISILSAPDGSIFSDHTQMDGLLWNSCEGRMGVSQGTNMRFNLSDLIQPVMGLDDLSTPFSKAEIDVVLKDLP